MNDGDISYTALVLGWVTQEFDDNVRSIRNWVGDSYAILARLELHLSVELY